MINKLVSNIETAVKIMKGGGLVIYPTETCYGIGCDALNAKARKKIYSIKKRERNKPLPIIVSSVSMIKKYAEIDKKTEELIKNFMPGPLTIIVKTNKTSEMLGESVAFRISSHPVAAALVRKLKVPLVATSANLSGNPPLYNIEEVKKIFDKKVDMIIDYGNLERVKPSTYVDMTSKKIKIIREGPVKKENIIKILV